MEQLHEYWVHWKSETWPIPSDQFVSVLESQEFADYKETRIIQYDRAGRHWDSSLEEKDTGYMLTKDGKLGFFFLSFNATFKVADSMDVSGDAWEWWDKFVEKHVAGSNAQFTSEMFVFLVTQEELFVAMIQGIVTSLVVALVAIGLITFNWVIALIGLLAISVILVCFLGMVPLIGWELGVYECIFMIAVVGLSVDYTVHLLHAYNEHEGESRDICMQQALASMGISVLSGAITTLLAGAMLFLCTFKFFQQFGQFIFFTIIASIVVALTFLPPLMLVIGPQGERGNIKQLFMMADALKGGKNKSSS